MLLGYLSADQIGGYYQPGQRPDKDVGFGAIRVAGHDIPSYLIHNPLLECLQIGATIRRVADSKLRKKDEKPQGIQAGIEAAALGVIEEVPFVRETFDIAKLREPAGRKQVKGQYAESLVVPGIVQSLAKQSDKNLQGKVITRKPQTVPEYIKSGVPGLRQTVPLPTTEEIKRLPVEGVLKVYEASPDWRKPELRRLLESKIRGAKHLSPSQRLELLRRIDLGPQSKVVPRESELAHAYA